jgi:hypothetical protein
LTLLDIHAEALAPARALVAALGLDAGVADWVQADAAAYRLDPDALPDVIVSETMSAALKREPQVAITRNPASITWPCPLENASAAAD